MILQAFNSAWNVQPENPNYNAHGCCVNHWYKVPVTLNPNIEEDERVSLGILWWKLNFEQTYYRSPTQARNMPTSHQVAFFVKLFISWLIFTRSVISSVNPPSLQVAISPSPSDILTHQWTQENDKKRPNNKAKNKLMQERRDRHNAILC